MNVLIVTTSCKNLTPGHPTGLWLEEFTIPYSTLSEAGAKITVVSPKGGAVPIDPKTTPSESDTKKWLPALNALKTTGRLSEVSSGVFDAIFLPGGHGPMIDLVNNLDLQRLIAVFDELGKIIAAVCHGPAALLNVHRLSGEPLIKGRKVTGFTAIEERLVMLHDVVPFLLENEMKDRGANFHSAFLPLMSHVERDGNLITGQNPASSKQLAEEMLLALRSNVSVFV